MITYHEIPDTNIVEFSVDGKITAAEFDDVLARFTAAIERHGKLRVLEHIRSFGGMAPSKWWEDIKFGFQHAGDISRAAVVADKQWIEVLAKLISPFFSAEIRYFDSADIDMARAWLREPEPADVSS